MIQSYDDTIYALASGKGRAGVAVVRLSGQLTLSVIQALTTKNRSEEKPQPTVDSKQFVPREARLTKIFHPKTNILIDMGLVLWFPAPHSFTGEDVAELHLHGSPAILTAIFEALESIEGVRMAERGEFTRRAFEQGKMDLTEAEGLNDLIFAETEGQRLQALKQMQGGLSTLYEGWREKLVHILAHLEADIDFPDEDLPEGVAAQKRPEIEKMQAEMKNHLADGHKGERIRSGFTVVLLGPPNVGKSSLLNALAKEDVAIVSDIAGTTRDTIEVKLDIGGFPVSFIDTAGLREAKDKIEEEGIRRARQKAENADLRLVMADALLWPDGEAEARGLVRSGDILCLNKIDESIQGLKNNISCQDNSEHIISAKTGEGLAELISSIENIVVDKLAISELPSLTRARHRTALEHCCASLERFIFSDHGDAVLEAEDVRLAARHLGFITGRVDVEEILDKVFNDFCIGK